MRKAIAILAVLPLLLACERDADVASRNLSKAADMFEITRRVVFYNGITDSYMMVVEGRCSVDVGATKVTVTCKVGPGQFKKHYLVRSDNTTMFAEQIETADVSVFHHRVIFKPQTIIPEIDARGDAGELLRNRH
jgi:hypothetical protein